MREGSGYLFLIVPCIDLERKPKSGMSLVKNLEQTFLAQVSDTEYWQRSVTEDVHVLGP